MRRDDFGRRRRVVEEEVVANTSSAIKRVRSNARKRQRNLLVRSATMTHMKQANAALSEGKAEDAEQAVKSAIQALDRAAGKGVLHNNNAARRKSRMMAKLNKLKAAPATA